MRLLPILLLSVSCLTSCMVGPNFQKPSNNLPESWATARPPASNVDNIREWWKIFGDSQLNNLLDQSLAYNPDMRMAFLRVSEARSAAKITGAALLPTAGAAFGASRQSVGGLGGNSASNFNLGADISWDLDIFGGTRRELEAALANLLSTEANAMAVRTLLLANVATTYFDWIASSEQLRVAEEQLAWQKRTLTRVENRVNLGGFDSKLDLEQAKAQVASTEASIPLIKASRDSSKNTLSTLLGSYLSRTGLKMPSEAVCNKTPTIPVGLPSELLRRRPDVIGAEADLHMAVANIGVAVSDLYPKFSLTGSLSSGARNFNDIFHKDSANWGIGGNIMQNLFQGGRLRERVKLQSTAALRAEEAYRKVLVTSVSEVEQALITYGSSVDRLQKMYVQNEANKKVLEYSEELWEAGEIEFLNVITAQRSLLSSEESIVTLKQTIRKSVVQLALALGGGW